MKRRRMLSLAVIGSVLVALVIMAPLVWRVHTVSGTVRDASGQPVAGASVRIRATQFAAQTDSQGRFTLTGFTPAFKARVTAWANGYYVTGRAVWPWEHEIALTLTPYLVPDNTSYSWIPPVIEERSAWQTLKIGLRISSHEFSLPITSRITGLPYLFYRKSA